MKLFDDLGSCIPHYPLTIFDLDFLQDFGCPGFFHQAQAVEHRTAHQQIIHGAAFSKNGMSFF
ncbi:MAG: hypothetical protein ACK2T5_09855, partial [Anaerolineales bacterium]